MTNCIKQELVRFFSQDFGSREYAQLLRHSAFELVQLALQAGPEMVNLDEVATSHYFLHKLADILDPAEKKKER